MQPKREVFRAFPQARNEPLLGVTTDSTVEIDGAKGVGWLLATEEAIYAVAKPAIGFKRWSARFPYSEIVEIVGPIQRGRKEIQLELTTETNSLRAIIDRKWGSDADVFVALLLDLRERSELFLRFVGLGELLQDILDELGVEEVSDADPALLHAALSSKVESMTAEDDDALRERAEAVLRDLEESGGQATSS